ncbi:MAG TPA: hypothetical protein PK020_22515, partial [Ilumatobacteraceae bacterium]|nr:hypothetical protein [Ilumatobacteraceae bacterium]
PSSPSTSTDSSTTFPTPSAASDATIDTARDARFRNVWPPSTGEPESTYPDVTVLHEPVAIVDVSMQLSTATSPGCSVVAGV